MASNTVVDNILSRDAYLAAYKSKNGEDFVNYREHVLSELIRPYKRRLFPTQLYALRERFEVSLQELVDATPCDTEVLERDIEEHPALTLEEQRDLVQRAHFENAFERLRENVLWVVKSTKYLPAVANM
ncbi:23538_t:CDS:1 [Racocetra persica]|uniref:23538_t:CDS:1 n=1 Tax=Racocetra persica TaxID=160502 RepID=A0ACA9NKP4_9GLOM|nr:23538_t:CDS:1 [Racocetra persica]